MRITFKILAVLCVLTLHGVRAVDADDTVIGLRDILSSGHVPNPVTTQTRQVTGIAYHLGGPLGVIRVPRVETRVDDGMGGMGLPSRILESNLPPDSKALLAQQQRAMAALGIKEIPARKAGAAATLPANVAPPVDMPNATPPAAPAPTPAPVPGATVSAPEPEYSDEHPLVDLMLLIDNSASMAPRWLDAQALVERVVLRLLRSSPNLRVGWVYVGRQGQAGDVHPLSTSGLSALPNFFERPQGSSGNAAKCISTAVDKGDFRSGAQHILLLIGDDGTVANKTDALAAAKRVKDELHGKLYAVVESRERVYNETVGQMCRFGGGALLGAGAKGKSAFDVEINCAEWMKP